jgi:hypothetical protein
MNIMNKSDTEEHIAKLQAISTIAAGFTTGDIYNQHSQDSAAREIATIAIKVYEEIVRQTEEEITW